MSLNNYKTDPCFTNTKFNWKVIFLLVSLSFCLKNQVCYNRVWLYMIRFCWYLAFLLFYVSFICSKFNRKLKLMIGWQEINWLIDWLFTMLIFNAYIRSIKPSRTFNFPKWILNKDKNFRIQIKYFTWIIPTTQSNKQSKTNKKTFKNISNSFLA
jgi:hypothetical protein